MTQGVRPADREAWLQWAAGEFPHDSHKANLATEAVLQALIAGYDTPTSMEIGRQAAAGRGGGGLIHGLFRTISFLFRLGMFLAVVGVFLVIGWLAYNFSTGTVTP